jgi:hypothetical protein
MVTVTAPGGQPALAALRSAAELVEGSDRVAPGCFGREMQAWLASPQQGLAADIDLVRGPEQTAAALVRLAPSEVAVLAYVPAGEGLWAEVARRAGGTAETCLVGLALDDGGAVARLIWLRAPAVPLAPATPAAPPPGARPIIESYFDDLMHARFRGAAEHFEADAIYAHPPYRGGIAHVLFRGRDALWRGFAHERGATPARQIVTGFSQHHDRFVVEGVVEGIPNGGSFLSTGQVTPAGRIARYVAFYSARRISVPPGP